MMPPATDSAPDGVPNVLTDAIFSVARDDQVLRLTLPELLARLLISGGGIHRLPRVTAEQHGPVWRFLVRCAAEALHTLGRALPGQDQDPRDLAGEVARVLAERSGGHQAWQLYEPDLGKPAFMQPPLPGGGRPEAAGYKAATVARLSLAVGGKNHERKVESGRLLDSESLVAALVTLQGGAIYTKGNYASPLMGSATGKGSGSPYVGARLAGTLDATFRHDVQTMLAEWDSIRRERGLRGSVWALWAERWDGESSLPSEALDPAFIPCARLLRMRAPQDDGRWSAIWYRSTKTARVIDATEGSGLGDPFLPLVSNPKRPGDRKARGTMGTGYRYDEVVRLLFGEAGRSGVPSPSVTALLDARPPDGARIRFEGMAFDQGKTLGFHHREILVPAGNYLDLEDPEPLRELHAQFLLVVKDAQAALRGAARTLLRGSPKPDRHIVAKTEAGAQALQTAVDGVYVDRLLAAACAARAGDDMGVESWRAWVRDRSLRAFEETRHGVPTPTGSRYQREVLAEAFLRRKLPAPPSRTHGDEPSPDAHAPADRS